MYICSVDQELNTMNNMKSDQLNSHHETSSNVLMDQVPSDSLSLINGKVTSKEQIKRCFKPHYKIRKLKNKGALMVITWAFLLASVYYNLIVLALPLINDTSTYLRAVFSTISVVVCLMLPVSGWLADVYFGRYKVIKCSILVMWIASILLVANYILAQQFQYSEILVTLVLFIPLGIGYGGFQANVIQFGIDQLTDASTTEITAFIAWYVWGFSSGKLPLDFLEVCLAEYKVFTLFLMSVFLTVATTSIFWFNQVLVKEPATQNPFKLVYGVIKFAIKNKHPRQRSAFTYCEDEPPSRIDFGKSKYGGPFTTEQVEDVKTLLRLLIVIVIGNAIGDIAYTETNFYHRFSVTTHYETFQECLYDFTIKSNSTQYIIAAILIPLCEFVIYPLFYQCLPTLKSYWKFILGAFILLGVNASYTILVTYTQHQYIRNAAFSHDNVSLHCLFQESSDSLSNILDYRWFAVPDFFATISALLIGIGAIEFFCAQIPYSMKGLVIGIIYGLQIIFILLDTLSKFLLTTKIHWSTGIISCTFWYVLTKFVLFLLAITTLLLVMRWYKNRKRDDVLPNEHIFAERYYSAIL